MRSNGELVVGGLLLLFGIYWFVSDYRLKRRTAPDQRLDAPRRPFNVREWTRPKDIAGIVGFVCFGAMTQSRGWAAFGLGAAAAIGLFLAVFPPKAWRSD